MTWTWPTDTQAVTHPSGKKYEYDPATESWNLVRKRLPPKIDLDRPLPTDAIFPEPPQDGMRVMNPETGTIYEYTSLHERWYVVIQIAEKGEKGEQGYSWKGEKGLRGDKAEIGVKGNKGSKGEKGFANLIRGEKGLRHTKGDKGEKGIKGVKGFKGIKGNRGKGGESGEKGNKGNKGPKGDKGNKGLPEVGDFGNKGNKGDAGVKGQLGYVTYGDQGNDGNKGYKGIRGPTGYTGYEGSPGNKGSRGAKGSRGSTGSTGPKGYRGANGSNGSDGKKPTSKQTNWTYGEWRGNTVTRANESGFKSNGGWSRNTGGSRASMSGNGRFRTLKKNFKVNLGERPEPQPTTAFVEKLLPRVTLEEGDLGEPTGYFINFNGWHDDRMISWPEEERLAAESFEVGIVVLTQWMNNLQSALEDLD